MTPSPPRGVFFNESGQLAVISILIIITLVLGIIVTVLVNQSSVRFGVMNQQRQKSDAIVQQGLAYAVHALADSPENWSKTLKAQFPPDFDPNHPPTGLTYFDAGINNYFFTVACSTGGSLSPYQTGLLVTAYVQNQAAQKIPVRAIRAAVSQKTLSATLTNNISASGALELFQAPSVSTVAAHWGPFVIHDTTNVWRVNGDINGNLYPRKFSGFGITDGGSAGTPRSEGSNGKNTDNKEYWAYNTLGYPPDIDMNAYQALAESTTITNAPQCTLPGPPGDCNRQCPLPLYPKCGHFVVANDTAVFDGGGTGYTFNQRGAVIYVEGNVRLDNVAIDLVVSTGVYPSSGAIVATGNIIVDSATVAGAGQPLTLRLPPTFAAEYPYYDGTLAGFPPSSSPPPCWGMTGSCTSAQAATSNAFTLTNKVNFRGFLYAQGNLIAIDSVNIFVIDGAVRANTVITQRANQHPKLTILYDDIVNRSILVSHLELQVDSQQPVSAR